MAVQVQSGAHRRGKHRQMSEINVTPFVDVMLVLLIVFMVTAPLLTVGVPVDLPKTKASAIEGKDEPLAVSIDAAGKVYLMETEVPIEQLVPRMQAIAQGASDRRIFIRADQTVAYGRVAEVMGVINAAGFTHVALVQQSADTATRVKH
ncbi:MAG TPA: protein TolR [Candidatus Sulfotelmatobacter sp.]|nr:protein TolR [Candidatus Sulfotelmatobacter sp.]